MARARAFYESVLKVEFTAITDPTEESLTMWGVPSDMEAYGALVHCESFAAGKTTPWCISLAKTVRCRNRELELLAEKWSGPKCRWENTAFVHWCMILKGICLGCMQ